MKYFSLTDTQFVHNTYMWMCLFCGVILINLHGEFAHRDTMERCGVILTNLHGEFAHRNNMERCGRRRGGGDELGNLLALQTVQNLLLLLCHKRPTTQNLCYGCMERKTYPVSHQTSNTNILTTKMKTNGSTRLHHLPQIITCSHVHV